MSFALPALEAAIARHGRVVRVVIAGHAGSSPREAGAAMLVWADSQDGTIGGGALELAATQRARALLARTGSTAEVQRVALGPALGQCCGGAVTLVYECLDMARLPDGAAVAHLRPVSANATAEPPLALRSMLVRARGEGAVVPVRLIDGWLLEPFTRPSRPLWVWGAGHVGRALVAVMSPLPDFSLTWIDTDKARFPPACPDGVRQLVAANPAELAPHAPGDAAHLIVTFSHALDLELCHRLLQHGFAQTGLIGSASKWARFRTRLRALGHTPAQIDRIRCPIGRPELGKHPQAIAVGVAAALLERQGAGQTAWESAG